MARVKLELPAEFPFSIDLPVRITDINYAGHMGNPVVLALLHEARFQFMAHHGLQELKVEGLGLIITDSAIIYKSEAFAGETLTVAVAVADFNQYGCDFLYRITEKGSGRDVAHAKTGIVFFDYERRTVQKIPQTFLKLFPDAAPV